MTIVVGKVSVSTFMLGYHDPGYTDIGGISKFFDYSKMKIFPRWVLKNNQHKNSKVKKKSWRVLLQKLICAPATLQTKHLKLFDASWDVNLCITYF